MYFTTILPLLSALAGFAAAQGSSAGFNITAVSIAIRSQWCTTQKSSCPLLCLQYPGNDASTTSNSCDPQTLDWSCVCAVNGMSPDVANFSQTVPYFECTSANDQCVNACTIGDNTCAANCRNNNLCGAQDPTRYNVTSSSSSMSQTATSSGSAQTSGSDSGDGSAQTTYATLGSGGSSATADAGSGTNASGQTGAGMSLFDFGRSYGMAVVLGSVFAGFALVL